MSIDEKTPENNATNAQVTPEQPAQPATAAPTAPTTQVSPEAVGEPKPRRRGFAAMDRDRVKEIASKGGRAAHAAGTAHQFNPDEARVAGKKGGLAPHVRRGGVRRRPQSEAAAPPSQNGQTDGR
jgi:general stress protein YciG